MRARVVLPLLAFLVVSLAAVAVVVTSEEAHGWRPVPGVTYPDLCRNRGPYAMPGVQNVGSILMRRVAFVEDRPRVNWLGRRHCVPVRRYG